MRTLLLLLLGSLAVSAEQEQIDRMDRDAAAGKPLVAHVVVCMCDNKNQGIVKVPASLGNGQDPASNLYWGALYGIRGYFSRDADWKRLPLDVKLKGGLLDKAVFSSTVVRGGKTVPVYLVAEAWDGREMKTAMERFIRLAGGYQPLTVKVDGADKFQAGGAAHVVAFIGHNGMMDVTLGDAPAEAAGSPARSSIVLACKSQPYFVPALEGGNSLPLLMTTGFMAPEAYTLEAAVTAWFIGEAAAGVHEAAAQAYHKYQKCGINGARRLFASSAFPAESNLTD